jgi:hypothetical protein
MGRATLGTYEFRIDPKSVKWSYSVKTNVTETVGGKVIQVFGTTVEAMTVEGSVGRGGKQEYRELLGSLVTMAKAQASSDGPVRFSYPPKGWEFDVYITGITDAQGATFTESFDKFHYSFTISLAIAEENAGLKKVAQDAYLERLAKGIGWIPNEYQGPDDPASALAIAQAAGFAPPPEDDDDEPSGPQNAPAGGRQTQGELNEEALPNAPAGGR